MTLPFPKHQTSRFQTRGSTDEPTESDRLLPKASGAGSAGDDGGKWQAPRGFIWIEIGDTSPGSLYLCATDSLDMNSPILKCLPGRVRWDRDGLNIRRDQLRLPGIESCVVDHYVVSAYQHGGSATLWPVLRHFWAEDLPALSDGSVWHWMPRMHCCDGYRLPRHDEGSHWIWRRRADDDGQVPIGSCAKASQLIAGPATIINSDLVPSKQRGMYQAVQNIVVGLGATFGACLGGFIADSLGWRFCFFLQVPVAAAAFGVGCLMVSDSRDQRGGPEPPSELGTAPGCSMWDRVDLAGALTMVCCLSLQTAALSMGSNALSWTDPWTLLCFFGSLVLLLAFVMIESKTKAVPILPVDMLGRLDRISLLVSSIGLGVVVYGVSAMRPHA